MKIFYIDINEFKNKKDISILKAYNDLNLKNEKRFFEYTIGRYLVKNVAKSVYNLDNTDIILNKSGKPVFEENKLFFNISHSKNIVIACFDNDNCAIDIEFIKNRDLDKFSKHFNTSFSSLEEFYKFWTFKEAKYKLGYNPKSAHSAVFLNEFYLTVVSNVDKEIKLEPVQFNKIMLYQNL